MMVSTFAAILAFGLGLQPTPAQAAGPVLLTPLQYDLSINLDYPNERLRASVRIELRNDSPESVREASFLLYRLLTVTGVTDDARTALPFAQAVVPFDDDGKLQVNRLIVPLAAPLASGARTALRLDYEGYLLGYVETGSAYVHDRIDPAFTILRDDAYAYPIPGYPSHAVLRQHVTRWAFTYRARITVPKGLTVANGGRLDGMDESGETITFRYASLKPSWRMDFAIAEYGSLSSDGFRVFYLPGDAEGARGVAKAAQQSMELFRAWFGPAPDVASLTFIEIPDGWGSQTDVTTIIQTAAAFRDATRHREVYHEISHLWNVSDADLPSPRLNEGLASFLEYLVDEQVTGEPRVDARADQLLGWLREQLPSHPRWSAVPLIDYGRPPGLTDLSYSVGALFFDLLYRLVGPDAFHRVIRDYTTRFATGGGTTMELMDVVLGTGSAGVAALVADWVDTTAWADRVQRNRDIHELEAYYRTRGRR